MTLALPPTFVAAARIAPLFSIWSSRWLMCGVRLSAKACLWPSCSCSDALARNSSSCSSYTHNGKKSAKENQARLCVRLLEKACLWPSCSCSDALARNSSSCSSYTHNSTKSAKEIRPDYVSDS
jgi:hypothetical protein